ncbi:MAG TPA: MotA/TolQ/ExbB proton channel family protein [Candidatus Tenderia electrophaga]|uniref:Biopolymer transport protein ExbB n=1 Tax=Candidatus Tenderia electrophaga TaxID=1748243 RepID=A0A832J6B8_9GAMM|nr:MotA/TolQ/ExbB proton channel family protein [Candidatus Tenderia electrophaga]
MENNPYGIEALWQQGDPVIKTVAVLLLLMSVASWTVIVIRVVVLWRVSRIAKSATQFWHAQSYEQGLEVLGGSDRNNPFSYLAEQGRQAMQHHATHKEDLHGHLPLADWLSASLRSAIDEGRERLQGGLSILASVGSTAPFIGLFGTVWGIYHALVNIGASGQAGIDKIAGPVGEALIMTAFGLAVAIPAVLSYNALVRGNKGLVNKLNRFAHQLHPYFLAGTDQGNSADKGGV